MAMKPPNTLLIDAETSGLWISTLPIDNPQQPWVCSCAAALCNEDGQIFQHFSLLIKSDGRTIKEGAQKVHGISARVSSQFGVPESRMLGLLSDLLKTAPLDDHLRIVSYGDFDIQVIAGLFARFAASQNKPTSSYDRLWLKRPLVEKINLMQPWAQNACKIPSGFDSAEYKFPSLDEAGEILLGKPRREGLHSAWDDLLSLRDLYLHFIRSGYFGRKEAA